MEWSAVIRKIVVCQKIVEKKRTNMKIRQNNEVNFQYVIVET